MQMITPCLWFNDQAEVVHVLAGPLAFEQVDDRVLVHAHRREEHLASAPRVDP